MDNDWVPIEFPTDIAEMLGEWLESDDGSVGLCLVCGESFGEADMISGTNFHNCPANVTSVFARLFDLPGDVTATVRPGFKLEGPSWRRVMAKMCVRLESIAPDGFAITSVKSKFGSLRIGYRGGDDAVEAVIDAAKMEAATTGEVEPPVRGRLAD
jgi:hypothetical protein